MAYDYRPVDRDQGFLIPPDIREWLDRDHVVWFVLDAVARMDTTAFHRPRRGRTNPASAAGKRGYDPDLLLVLLIYAYAVGERSSRRIERLCQTDVAFRVLCGNDIPDHTVIARFRRDHDTAFVDLFTAVLMLCQAAGMGRFGQVALDGTKIAANAAKSRTRSETALRNTARDITDDAYRVDHAEETATRRGDHHDQDRMPPGLRSDGARSAAIEKALARIEERKAADTAGDDALAAARVRADRTRAKFERLDAEHRARTLAWQTRVDAGDRRPGPRPVPTEQNVTVQKAKAVADRAKAAHENLLVPAEAGGRGRTYRANLTDPESALMKTRGGFIQGYNAQLVASDDHLIIAADLTDDPTDPGWYRPMITAATDTITQLWGGDTEIGCVLADAGYCSQSNLTAPGPDRLIATGSRRSTGPRRAESVELAAMRARLATDAGRAAYKRRGAVIEPINAHLKDRRGLRTFSRRGLVAAKAELHLAAAVTNLLRLFTTGPQLA